MTASIRIESVIIEVPGDVFVEADKFCTTSPPPCCGMTLSCLPPGYEAIKIEFTTYEMPFGARLEKEFCEYLSVCCVDSGTGTGSGQCQTCCTDVYPYYIHSTTCCASPLPEFIPGITFSGDCAELNGAHWSTGLFFSSGFGNVWLGSNGASDPHPIALTMRCVDGVLSLDVTCNGVAWLTIPLTVSSCCPFSASGTTTAPPSDCCAGGTVSVSLFAPGGSREQSGTGSGVGGCIVLAKIQEWSFPENTQITALPCEIDPECCNDVHCSTCCNGQPMPQNLYFTVIDPGSGTGSGDSCNNGVLNKTVKTYWDGVCGWNGVRRISSAVIGSEEGTYIACVLIVVVQCNTEFPTQAYFFAKRIAKWKGSGDPNADDPDNDIFNWEPFGDCIQQVSAFGSTAALCDRPILDLLKNVCFPPVATADPPLCGPEFIDLRESGCCEKGFCVDILITE